MRALAVAAVLAAVPLVAATASPSPAPRAHHPAAPKAKRLPANTTTTVTMPGDLNFAFKPGAGSTTATTYCLTCHSSAYVSTQPPLTRAQWAGEVTKMRNVFGTVMSDAEAETVIDYLTEAYGKKS